MKEEEKTFAEFVDHWKERGYEVRVTNGFLKDLEELDSEEFSLWELLAVPFELAEDLLDYLPRNKLISWLSGWMATLAIMANKPLYEKLMRRRRPHAPTKTYRIA